MKKIRIENGRRPWLYRNGGKAIVPFDDDMPYPRLCAHRGFNTVDFGVKFGERFKGLRIVKFEDILRKFAGHTIMNIHIKTCDYECDYSEKTLRKIVDMIDKFDCRKHVYFMCGNDNFHALAQRICPDITRCMGGGTAPLETVERAIKYGCKKIQLVNYAFTQEMISKAHEHGIRCNMFWADEPKEAEKYLEMGVDCILTNDYLAIKNACFEK